MSIAFTYAARSDTGRVRAKNDDSAYTGHYLAVVADGMGGHVGGNVASASTVLDLTPLDHGAYDGEAGTFLADEIQTANIILNQLVEVNPLLAGMGTTCTALLVDGDHIELAHIGDSRAYRLREGRLEQMTTDHTFVQRLVEEGRLRPEEVENHPHKNVIMRVLGDTDASPELELKQADAVVGDRWLLCSDGLSGVVADQTIQAVLSSTADLQEVCETLVDLTLDRGAPDNVTVAALEVVDVADLTPPTSRLEAVPDAASAPADGSADEAEPTTGALPWAGPDGQADTAEAAEAAPAESATAETATAEAATAEAAESAPDEAADPAPASPNRRVAPWRHRIPRPKDVRIRHTLRHGVWRGDSFSDGVLNAMTERSGVDVEEAREQEESPASLLRNELALRPHLIVGAAASATMTGAIPTVTDSTVRRRATLAETHQAEESEVDEELPPELLEDLGETRPQKRRRWALTAFIWAFALVLVVGAALAGLAWTRTQYFVGTEDGMVTVYRGVDQSLGPLRLYEVQDRSTLAASRLSAYTQTRLEAGITANDEADAERILAELRSEAGSGSGSAKTPTPKGTVSDAASASPSSSTSASSQGTSSANATASASASPSASAGGGS